MELTRQRKIDMSKVKNIKVRVVMEFEVPFEMEKRETIDDVKGFIIQDVFSNVEQSLICGHLKDAVMWCADAKQDKSSTAWMIYENHKKWAKILENGKHTIDIL